eukprot:4263880-Prymnesium_polylepis.1
MSEESVGITVDQDTGRLEMQTDSQTRGSTTNERAETKVGVLGIFLNRPPQSSRRPTGTSSASPVCAATRSKRTGYTISPTRRARRGLTRPSWRRCGTAR